MSDFKFNSRKPRYNDDSDYTTNAPSYYDDLARKNQLIKYLAKRIWEYEKTLNESLEEIENILNNYIDVIDGKLEVIDHLIGEGFNDRIEVLLREWLADGTLDYLINEVVFEQLNKDIKEFKEKIENDFNEHKEKIENDFNNHKEEINKWLNCINNDVLNIGNIKFYRGG